VRKAQSQKKPQVLFFALMGKTFKDYSQERGKGKKEEKNQIKCQREPGNQQRKREKDLPQSQKKKKKKS